MIFRILIDLFAAEHIFQLVCNQNKLHIYRQSRKENQNHSVEPGAVRVALRFILDEGQSWEVVDRQLNHVVTKLEGWYWQHIYI